MSAETHPTPAGGRSQSEIPDTAMGTSATSPGGRTLCATDFNTTLTTQLAELQTGEVDLEDVVHTLHELIQSAEQCAALNLPLPLRSLIGHLVLVVEVETLESAQNTHDHAQSVYGFLRFLLVKALPSRHSLLNQGVADLTNQSNDSSWLSIVGAVLPDEHQCVKHWLEQARYLIELIPA